jgi:hypothetical protein
LLILLLYQAKPSDERRSQNSSSMGGNNRPRIYADKHGLEHFQSCYRPIRMSFRLCLSFRSEAEESAFSLGYGLRHYH